MSNSNIFANLEVSDDEQEVKKTVQKKAAAPKAAAAPKDAKAAPKAAAPKTGAKDQKKTAKVAELPVNDETEVSKENQRGGKPHGKGSKHGAKKYGDAAAAPRREKRQFDRKSGTGRGKEVSKEGRGKFGAGSVKQEAENAEKHPENVEAEANEDAAQETAAEPVVEEPPSITLEAFLAEREATRSSSAILGQAQAKRVVDASAYSNLGKVGEELNSYLPGKLDQTAASATKKEQRSTAKQSLAINFSFAESTAPRREKEQRDFKGKKNSAPKQKAAPVTFSNNDFPSLA